MNRVLVGLFALAIMVWALATIVSAVHRSAFLSLFVAAVVMLGVSGALTYAVFRRR